MDITRLRADIIARWASVDIQFVGLKARDLALTLAVDEFINAAQESGTQAAQTTNSRYVTALHVYLQWCAEVRLDTVNNLLSYHTWLNERLNAEEPHCT